MKNICEWNNCKETGEFKAPIEKDNSRKYRWMCEDHIKLFNKNWNYFEGMGQDQIENFLKSDLTWHRPTQQFGSTDNFFNILWNNALNDKFSFFQNENNTKSFNGKKLSEKVLLVLDDAYFEYMKNKDYKSALNLFKNKNNVFILRTFSKIYGLTL